MKKISAFLVAFLMLTAIFVLVGVFVLNRPAHQNLIQNPPQSLTGKVVPVDDRADSGDACHYAVICGGIHDLVRLGQVISSDQLAASLYAGFDFRTAKVITLQQDVWAYIAYRRDGHIFYTHAKHRIRAGESVLSDGSMMILTRCGNRLLTDADETVPQEAVEPLGIYPPTDALIDTPLVPSNITPPLYAFLPPTPTPPSQSPPVYTAIPPVYYPPVGCCSTSHPPVAVPEPSSFVLLTVGLAALGLMRFLGREL